ncbi:hypothetical protein ACQPZ2_18800 [Nocardia pseudovaccinii]|uniref:hypothetical protein n=1 Tax=Nocardia pseudovaccinii TaxID=189540 RepID=UPI003D9395AB
MIMLDFDTMTIDAAKSLRLMACTAKPDTRDAENLALLNAWAAAETASPNPLQ